MTSIDSTSARQFAVQVVAQLRAAGFEALWAGGCVRDELLGNTPKDYDVATSALPEQVRAVFGRRKTLAIGAAFGVITVVGPREAGQVEVATFRRDAAYSDGRRPDSVAFTNAEEDARRRDFTINGLFFDPVSEQVIDYVGGRDDLQRRVVRAIGDPAQRFAEDKLRMLRAVRFAATFEFELEPKTLAAVRAHASELTVVSAERIAAEMRRMLAHPTRAVALRLLRQADLLPLVLPEIADLLDDTSDGVWKRVLQTLDQLPVADFIAAVALLLRERVSAEGDVQKLAGAIAARWRLSTDERLGIVHLLNHEALILSVATIDDVRSNPVWPRLQRVLVAQNIERLLAYCETVAVVIDGTRKAIQKCRELLGLPTSVLNPVPLLTGDDLNAAGFKSGPKFREVLNAVRDAQLLGRLTTKEQAFAEARRILE